jgi:hypothetical protein
MSKMKVALLLISLPIIILCINTTACYGNSAEPPSILIIVPNAPNDLEITLGPENTKAQRTDKVMESYFTFYRYQLQSRDYTITFTSAGNSFNITLDDPLNTYNNIFTLDLKRHTLTRGESLPRNIKLISIRIALTLVIEGIIFFIFGYRKKRSWLIFLIVNLVTQAGLNTWLSISSTPQWTSLILLLLVFGELMVFIVEMAVFLIMINEHRRWRTAAYVIIANVASAYLGGFLITLLPL